MTFKHLMKTSHPLPKARWFRSGASVILTLTLAQLLAGCQALQPVAQSQGAAAQGWWVELDSPAVVSVSPGVEMELPQAPYRARFTDPNGIYYQASRPLTYRTAQGVHNSVQGGLYVRHDNPRVAHAWVFPELGAQPAPYTQPIAIQLHKPR